MMQEPSAEAETACRERHCRAWGRSAQLLLDAKLSRCSLMKLYPKPSSIVTRTGSFLRGFGLCQGHLAQGSGLSLLRGLSVGGPRCLLVVRRDLDAPNAATMLLQSAVGE